MINQFARITAVSPNEFKLCKAVFHLFKNQFRAISILYIRAVHNDTEDETKRVNQQMAFPALYLFTSVIATKPPFFTVFTDWLSSIPAVGSICLPEAVRTLPRKASWISFQCPFFFQKRK